MQISRDITNEPGTGFEPATIASQEGRRRSRGTRPAPSSPTSRPADTGTVPEFRLGTGRAGSKTGQLRIEIEYWYHDQLRLRPRAHTALVGYLTFGRNADDHRHHYIDATAVISGGPARGTRGAAFNDRSRLYPDR